MAQTKTAVQTANKKKAVMYLLEHAAPKMTKKQSNKKMREVAIKYDIATSTLKLAYENYLNFKTIDLRKSTGRKQNVDWDKVRTKSLKYKKLRSFKTKDLTTREIKGLLNEYFFGTNLRISDYLLEKEINPNQWYKWLREMKISGKVGNSRVFDFSKYGKPIDMNSVFKYAKMLTQKHKTLSYNLTTSMKKHVKCLKSLNKTDETIVRRLVKVLFAYTSSLSKKESREVLKHL